MKQKRQTTTRPTRQTLTRYAQQWDRDAEAARRELAAYAQQWDRDARRAGNTQATR